MARVGDVMEDATSGVRLVFRATSQQTEGRAVVVEMFLPPRTGAHGSHLHPAQEERVDVLNGSVMVRLGRDVSIVEPGERVIVPRGTRHAVWNTGTEVAHVVCELRPALQFESLMEALLTSPPGGGLHVLRTAAIVSSHFDTVRLPFLPGPIQRPALRAVAGVSRLLER